MSEASKSKSRVISVRRIVEIDSVINSIGGMDMLTSQIAYVLGRLGQYCASISKLVNREKEKLVLQYRVELKSEQTLVQRKNEITKLINDRMDSILDIEETIQIPVLKLSDFTAKSDRTITIRYSDGSTNTREYKEGEQLVPQMFFTIFGPLIMDDKSTGEFKLQEKESNLFKMLGSEEELAPQTSEEREIQNKLNDKKASVELAEEDK